jgi:hypothetical protein
MRAAPRSYTKNAVVHQFEFGRAERMKRTLMSAFSPETVIVPVR